MHSMSKTETETVISIMSLCSVHSIRIPGESSAMQYCSGE